MIQIKFLTNFLKKKIQLLGTKEKEKKHPF